MMSCRTTRAVWILAALATAGGLAGCGLISDLLPSGGGSTTIPDAVYISVYNFRDAAKTLTATVTYPDRNGSDTNTSVLTSDGSTTIPGNARGETAILVSNLTTSSESPVTVTFTFPNDGDTQTTVSLTRGDLQTNKRMRFGVFGTDTDSIRWFVD